MWRYEFEKYGGYDSMTDAFILKENNKEICRIDQSDFGQENCQNYGIIILEAENYAKLIVDAVNAFIKK